MTFVFSEMKMLLATSVHGVVRAGTAEKQSEAVSGRAWESLNSQLDKTVWKCMVSASAAGSQPGP